MSSPGIFSQPEIHAWVTTANEFQDHRVKKYLGVVRGITVRSRSVVGNLGAALQTLVGGNITIYTQLCEHARQEAYDIMVRHAAEVGANAIIAMRYDANEIGQGVTEVLCYGTAVIIEPRH
ncbi:MAG: YbjQ family protein [Fimbriimonadaceae bacterium]|nr:YbjQ family protein [Fimbriimonadaceae bacterium]QYK56698.1 MAG: YbjQ family protein [Fimbriimonadaceae bacterium]